MLLSLAAFSAGTLAAQSFTPVRELKNLSPAAIETLHTLETLNALAPGDWRYHAGDLPHGESVSLDDSAWQVVPTPERRHGVKATEDAVWYRRWIEVPKTLNGYDITGSRIWFQFHASANGPMPEIVYFNGRRVALGDDLEPIVLFEPAHPGDRVLVAVKLLRTVDVKTFEGVTLRVEPVTDTAHPRPNPETVRTEAITAANLLPALPQPRKDLLPRVEEAVHEIDLNALRKADQKAFDASLERAQKTLSTLAPTLSSVKVDLTGNAHIDAAWLWPRSETIDVVKRTFSTALQLMNEYPDYTYAQSAAQYSAWMADKYPEMNKQIAQRIKEGRWEIVGGMWVEPDLNLPGGESLVRQLLVGQRVFHNLYGVTARIGWNPDSFGYNWQLPQIYKRSGMDYFVTQKMHWNDTNQLPFRLFWWQSPDGSKVLTYFPTDYVHDNVNPTRISADVAESVERNPGLTEHLDLYGIGDHGGGPTRDMLDQATRWIDLAKNTQTPPAAPAMHFSTAQHFFSDVEAHLNPNSPVWNYDTIAKGYTAPPAGANGEIGLPTWNDELYFEYHRGVFTSQAAHKRNMRVSEEQTLDTEKLASVAWLYGAQYPAGDLTENWKKITFNQFHDLAAGSGIAVIYRDSQKDYTEVEHTNALINRAALNTILGRVNTAGAAAHAGSGAAVVVLNPLPWARTETAAVRVAGASDLAFTDANGHAVASERVGKQDASGESTFLVHLKDVPSMGYTVLHAAHAAAPQHGAAGDGVRVEESSDAFVLSNGKLRVAINRANGCITSLTNVSKTEFLAPNGCGNQLQTFADNPKNYDAWNVDPGTLDKAPAIVDKVDSISVASHGSLRKAVRVVRSFGQSHITQDIALDAGADVVVLDTTVDWHETHTLLKAAFPLAATSGKATYEIPFGSIGRATARDNTFNKAQFEVPALRWADLGDAKQGVSILNDSKYGYDGLGNTLRLTLLRSPTWPDPDADRGQQHFRYAIYPHAGSWQKAETIHRAYELNEPLGAVETFAHNGTLPATHSFVSVEGAPNVVVTAVKKAEDSDALIIRMYEATGQAGSVKLHVPAGAVSATEANLMEKAEGAALPLSNNVVSVAIKPFEIRTVEVTYHPASAPSEQ